MAGYVCTIAGGNGGVGKTTTAVNVAAALESLGYDTAVIDADLGMPNIGEMFGLDHDGSLHDILAGNAAVSETLTNAPGGMTIIPGEPALEAYAEAETEKLRSVVNTLRQAYDVVLVDTAAGLRGENTVLLELADGVILTTIPDHVSLTDTDKTRQLAEAVDSEIIGTLVVRATAETPMADIDEEFDFPVLGGIPDDLDVAGAEPMVLESPNSEPAKAYKELATALEKVFFEGAKGDDLPMVPENLFG
jgi:septum site-determining protein MinD